MGDGIRTKAEQPGTSDAEPRLRPAGIQTRLRAGDSPEQLVGLTELTLEQIRRFEGPIAAERADAISRLQHHKVAGTAGKHTIGELVLKRLGARGIDRELHLWTARREPAAPWLIELRFDDGARSRSARWTYDSARGLLTALDDDARWLSSPEEPETITPITGLGRAGSAAKSGAKGGAVARLSELPTASGAPTTIPQSARRPPLRGDHLEGQPELAGIVPIKRWQSEKIDTVAIPIAHPTLLDSENTVPRASNHPAGRGGNPVGRSGGPAGRSGGPAPQNAGPTAPVRPTADASDPPTPESGKKKGRATVPSWDEIVFGSKD